MNQEQLSALSGKIDRVYGSRGIQPRLYFALSITNKNAVALDLLSIRAELYVEFLDSADAGVSQIGKFLGNLKIDNFGGSSTVNSGENNYWSLYLPLPLSLFAELEEARQRLNLSFQVNVLYIAVERQDGTPGRTLSTELFGGAPGGNKFLSHGMARSLWEENVRALGYTEELGATRSTVTKMLDDIAQSKRQAEQWAEDTRVASIVTAENALSRVHSLEEAKLRKAAWPWLIASAAVAVGAVVVLWKFLQQSSSPSFGIPQAILRVGTLGLLGYALAACFRLYKSYKSFELMSRHRANIGQTFAALLTAQPSPEAKNVLAGIAADQMMNFGRNGLAGKDGDEREVSSWIELIKNFSESKK